MTTYKLSVPPTMEQGGYNIEFTPAPHETPAQCALWHYNSARAHDGLEPLRRMPKGTRYTNITARLVYLRREIESERISYGEIAELQSLAKFIEPGDALLLEWAGVPEFEEG